MSKSGPCWVYPPFANSRQPRFEDFVQLPSRALKDYYQHIKQPMSITAFRKLTRGEHGRKDATFVSDFRSWAAFEESCSLLWENAYFYNDDDSEIFQVAKELEKFCKAEIKKAKDAVEEPPQTKIKLKVNNEQAAPSSKKITIQVGNRGGSIESPAPTTARSLDSRDSEQPAPIAANSVQALSGTTPAVDRVRSISAASPAPSAPNGIKKEDTARSTPTPVTAQANGTPAAARPAGLSTAQFQPIPQAQPAAPVPPPVVGPNYNHRYRPEGKGARDALLTSLRVQAHPSPGSERGFTYTMLPKEREAAQSVTVHVPANQLRIQIIPTIAQSLQAHQRQYRVWVMVNRHVLNPQQPPQGQMLPANASVFEAQLQAGIVNTIDVHIIAAVPKAQHLPSGEKFELEQYTMLANVIRN